MNSTSRTLTLVLVVLLLSSLLVLTVTSANVHAISKPSVPQFTVKHDNPSADGCMIKITIKNQPFTPYIDANGNEVNLYYIIEAKSPCGDNWSVDNRIVEKWSYWLAHDYPMRVQSNSEYTVVSWPARVNGYPAPVGSQIDFRVNAKIGYLYDTVAASGSMASVMGVTAWSIHSYVTSDWSSIQTITITDKSSSTLPSQTTLPTNPAATPDINQPQQPDQIQPPSFVFHSSFLLWIGTFLFVGVVVVVVMVFIRRHLRTPNYNDDYVFVVTEKVVCQREQR